MHSKTDNRHMIDILFVLTLFCVFAISALTLVTLGADIYQQTVNHMETNFESRTPYSYITQKIRQADHENSISLDEIDGIPAIKLQQMINQKPFDTYLYAYEGYLTELMVHSDQQLPALAGSKIIEISDFSIEEMENNLFSVDITTKNNEAIHMKISTRCGNEDS